jgi:hypothetical protein
VLKRSTTVNNPLTRGDVHSRRGHDGTTAKARCGLDLRGVPSGGLAKPMDVVDERSASSSV